jgi:hypothetical protein
MSLRALLAALPLVTVACFGSSQQPGPDGVDSSVGIDAPATDDASTAEVGDGAIADAGAGEAEAEEGAMDAAAEAEAAVADAGRPDAEADGGRADAEAGAVDAGADGATSSGGDAATGGFSCGPTTCDAATQICSIVNGHLPDQAATYECVLSEGGPPSCPGAPGASSPGACGCYESPAGEVTSTLCPP